MPRISTILAKRDDAGDYEIEVFDCLNPKRVIVCSHGNGVRRWDGEKFFYAVAEHYADSAVLLVDQNQVAEAGGIQINPLPILAKRVNELVGESKRLHPESPVVLMGHSMGCGVATFVDLAAVNTLILVTPAAGDAQAKLIERYGQDVAKGKSVTTSDGLIKVITADYFASLKGIVWEDEYAKLVKRYQPIYVFEAGEEEIVSDERLKHRHLSFGRYEIIEGAHHNLTGEPLMDFFAKLDQLI
jgi:pimeloyl-ACP methyl ester carboxylesterase